MKWIIQQSNNNDVKRLLAALEKYKQDYSIHKVIPFSDILIPEPDVPRNKGIVFGANTLCQIAKDRKWLPGVFTNQSFTYRTMLMNLGDLCLNFDARITYFDELDISETTFIRPNLDTKIFAGHLIYPENFYEWKKYSLQIAEEGYTTLTGSTEIVAAKPQEIINEYRIFIIGGKISTYSTVKLAGRFCPEFYVPQEVLNFAQKVINVWLPHECCVLDVCLTAQSEYKVLEFNCLNDSGFYSIDVDKLVFDLIQYLKA